MRLLTEIKERRLIPLTAAYLVTGFVALEGVTQLNQYGFLPNAAYPVALVLYLFGIPSSFIFAWFHGAPGRQYAVRGEILLQGLLGFLAITTGVFVYRTQVVSSDVAAEMGLPRTSIAVLPFEDVSSRGDIGYVADGITDALIDELDDVRSLDVISKTGVSRFRDSQLRPDSIARILSVGTIIMGTVNERAGELVITTSLVDGVGGVPIDRTIIEIPSGEFLAATDSVAVTVAALLREQLGEDVRVRELRAGTTNQDAWALAQRADRIANDAEDNFERGGEPSSMIRAYTIADSLLAIAESLDSRWARLPGARAQAASRRACVAVNTNDLETARAEIDEGYQYADRALSLDSQNAYALEQRGTLKVLETLAFARDQQELERMLGDARTDLEAAIREDPSLATAYAMLSFLWVGLGNNTQAIIRATQALDEDAYLRGADRIYDRLTYAQYDEGEFNEARHWCDEGRRRFPENFRFTECELWLAAAPGGSADVDEAWQLLDQLEDLTPDALLSQKRGLGQILVAGVLRKANLTDSAQHVLDRVDFSEQADPPRLLHQYEAAMLASTGDPDGAMDALMRWAVTTPDATLGSQGSLHWWWRTLQNRPDFQQFIERN